MLPNFRRNFKGVVGLANWLRRHNYYTTSDPANLSQGGVWPSFKEAVKRYRDGKEIYRFYVPSLILENISIHKEYSDFYKIWIPERYNICHKRFALCKELCHILTDEHPVKSADPRIQLRRALNTVQQVLASRERDPEVNPFFSDADLNSEDFNLLLALEILFPVKLRDSFMGSIQSNRMRPYDVALHVRIPESLVLFFIHSGYNRAFKRVGGIDCALDD